jgi:HEAT repeat protein
VSPELDAALIAHLAELDPAFPDTGGTAMGRRALRTTALGMLLELRGPERERLTAVLEHAGIVAESAGHLGSRSRRTRRRAADALAQYRSAASTDALVGGLDDDDAQVRIACARGLAELGDPRYIQRIVEVAAEAAPTRGGLAADLLLALAASSPSTLGGMLEEGRPELQRLAAAVVGELRLADQAPGLRAALSSANDAVAERAARGSGLIGDAEAVEPLLALLRDHARPWPVRAAAASALGAIGDASTVGALEAALREDEWSVQVSAASALAALGAPGRETLERARADERADLRGHAIAALDR